MDLDKFQIICLNEAYENWENPETRFWFSKAISLKYQGYKGKYDDGVIPVDTTEFIGTHILICEKTNDGPVPVMGFRSLTLDCCNKHFTSFPLLQIAKSAEEQEHIKAVKNIIDRSKETGVRLSYNGGWTILPELRRNTDINHRLKDIMIALDFLFHDHCNTVYEILGAGVLKFKTEKYFNTYGYDYMTLDENELSVINSKYLGDEKIKFLHVKNYNEKAKSKGLEYKSLWDNRIEIGEKLERYESHDEYLKKAA